MTTLRPPSNCDVAPASDVHNVATEQRASSSPSSSSSSTRRRRRMRRPGKNSIYDIFHQHSGTSLFVRPICWTDFHSKLLGARFFELPPCDTPLPASVAGSPPSKGHMRPSAAIQTLSEALTNIMMPPSSHPLMLSNAVRTVLSTLWPDAFGKPHFLAELNLVFGGRVYRDAVRAQALWCRPTEGPKSSYSSFRSISTRPASSFGMSSTPGSQDRRSTDAPMMCYINKKQLATIRRNLFRVVAGPNRSPNEPVSRLQQLRAKALMPSDPDNDAHFVSVFLAMAQRYFYAAPDPMHRRNSQWSTLPRPLECPEFHDVELKILTHDTDTSDFIVYTGLVTEEFLRWFHNPFATPGMAVPGIKIEYTRVPVWPILGLRERLGQALGPGIVGEFDPDVIETWEEQEEENVEEEIQTASQNGKNGKRKREALAEVFNGSFEEPASSSDEPVLSGKKRCLGESSPLGVVV